ncbi:MULTISPECIES: LuxR family transcriptional regulator [Aphanothece]|uniref:LuxR family transcriptional regulator n=1 Tax=Aphanothece TaxID=1121 RepID=UPI0039855FA8
MVDTVILEDQVLLAELLHHELDRIPGLTVVDVAHSVEDGKRLCRAHRPDLLLMDLLLPDGQGVEVAECLLQDNPTARVVVLSAQSDRLSCSRRLHEAILAVVDKGSAVDTLHLTLQREVQRRVGTVNQHDPLAALTARERQVLALIGQGCSSEAIARRLTISTLTARTHRRNIIAKLGFKGPELVLLASGNLPQQA